MKENLAVKTFDYSGIDPEVKSKLIWLSGEVVRSTKTHVMSAMEIGKAIADAHALLAEAGCKGKFTNWLDQECHLSRTTAYRYMQNWERFGNCPGLGQFTNEALELLSGPDVPLAASKEAEKKAGKGVRINLKVARAILGKFRVAQSKANTNGKAHAELPAQTTKPAAEAPAEPEPAEDEAEAFDPAAIDAQPANGVDIPGLASPYKRAVTDINRMLRDFDEIVAEERTGVHLADKHTRIKTDLQAAKGAIYQAEPVQACEKCGGEGCKTCYQSGFWTRAIVGSRKK